MARVLGLAVLAAQGFHSRVIWGPWRKLHRRVMRPDLFLKGILFWLLVKNRFRARWKQRFQLADIGRSGCFR